MSNLSTARPWGLWIGVDIASGVALAADLAYSGEYQWVETWTYWRAAHEVMPASMALSCVQCHESLKGENTCNRCHKDNRDVDFKKLAQKGTDFNYMASMGRDASHLWGQRITLILKCWATKATPLFTADGLKNCLLAMENKVAYKRNPR